MLPSLALPWLDVTPAVITAVAGHIPPSRTFPSQRLVPASTVQYTCRQSHLDRLVPFLLRRPPHHVFGDLPRLQERMATALERYQTAVLMSKRVGMRGPALLSLMKSTLPLWRPNQVTKVSRRCALRTPPYVEYVAGVLDAGALGLVLTPIGGLWREECVRVEVRAKWVTAALKHEGGIEIEDR